MNISRIANLKAGGEWVSTAQSTYWSCHDTIRTQLLNWSEICRNRKFGTAVRFQPGQIHAVLCPGRVTTRQDHCGSGFWPGLEPNRTEPPVKTQSAGGLPGPFANTTHSTSTALEPDLESRSPTLQLLLNKRDIPQLCDTVSQHCRNYYLAIRRRSPEVVE